ncbi:putative ABC transporter ATP-binding protein YxlF [Planctopirus ephydatiae]|uniref:Putative ABC transporter ATP-binding protein YxlF n=1 Tax=Planctopirus ephydatiae TaxID=2528019 RepID=A0A518GT99_9PLAN|nr:ABC transporter ATP-binding protein [Planctopirus ephydatiae]QDV31818.1 putative ABC transporter ATP-binding protein YxlF [Planctopirus ephydatiae]
MNHMSDDEAQAAPPDQVQQPTPLDNEDFEKAASSPAGAADEASDQIAWADPNHAISLHNVTHRYQGKKALDRVSFVVEKGALHGFVGPNGAGKTTSLKLVCTLLQPQAGRVRVFGEDVVDNIRKVRTMIGFMPDHFSTYRQMTVNEYLDFFAAAYGLPPARRIEVIEQVLSLVDMNHRQNDLISGLSRGMQQRVGLARVLVNDPELLLLDEPASGLDPRARIELMDILRALRSMGKTIFISSHILSELAELCDAVTIIDRGEIRFSGRIGDLLTNPQNRHTLRFEFAPGSADMREALAQIEGVVSAEKSGEGAGYRVEFDPARLDANQLVVRVASLGVPLVSFSEDRRQLNEAFMDLTTAGVR